MMMMMMMVMVIMMMVMVMMMMVLPHLLWVCDVEYVDREVWHDWRS